MAVILFVITGKFGLDLELLEAVLLTLAGGQVDGLFRFEERNDSGKKNFHGRQSNRVYYNFVVIHGVQGVHRICKTHVGHPCWFQRKSGVLADVRLLDVLGARGVDRIARLEQRDNFQGKALDRRQADFIDYYIVVVHGVQGIHRVCKAHGVRPLIFCEVMELDQEFLL